LNAAQAKANSAPITLNQIRAAFGGTLSGPHAHIGGDPDRVLTSIDLGTAGGNVAVQVVLDPSAPDGINVHGPLKVLADCDDHVRDKLGLPRQARVKAANDNARAIKATPYRWRSTQDTPLREFLYGKEHVLAANWAGIAVARILELDLEDADAKPRIKKMLAAWTLPGGPLKVEARRDPG
jgi:hypothetical protein